MQLARSDLHGVLAVKKLIPHSLRRLSRRVKADFRVSGNRHLSAQQVFTKVYSEGMWGGDPGTFFSGPGSNEEAAKPYAEFVTRFMAERNVNSVVDLGCGDFRVGRLIAASGVNYTGVDVVEGLIEDNTRRYASPTVRFQCADITADALPPGDVCLIREVFQHLSNAQVKATLAKLSHYKYVLITEVHPDDLRSYQINRDKPHGATSRLVHFSVLSLDKPPFNITDAQLVFEIDPPYFQSYEVFGQSFKLKTFLISSA
jgi:2-polyprenyl-3-methyl-5-hydroxy-6-metoxy-1,4-benzoquinol methylase